MSVRQQVVVLLVVGVGRPTPAQQVQEGFDPLQAPTGPIHAWSMAGAEGPGPATKDGLQHGHIGLVFRVFGVVFFHQLANFFLGLR